MYGLNGVPCVLSGDPSADLVRHFLIEPTPKGVRLKGCSNEPVFGKLCLACLSLARPYLYIYSPFRGLNSVFCSDEVGFV